jgi:LemA protein
MTSSLLLWALFAISIFWGVGVYNRLMRMRAKGLEAMVALDRYLQRYDALVRAHLSTDLHDAATEWSDLQSALSALNGACQAVRLVPLGSEVVQALAQSYQSLQDAWTVLRDFPNDLAGQRLPEGLQVEWERVSQKVMYARNKYHQIATEYNRALNQFPAHLLVRILGFKAAGTL